MEGLESRIRGDWYDIRERLHRIDDLRDYLCSSERVVPLPQRALTETASGLEGSVEGGCSEYLKNCLIRLKSEFEEAAYSSGVFGKVGDLAANVGCLVLVVAVARAALGGDLPFGCDDDVAQPGCETPDGIAKPDDIRQIMTDVQHIVAADPTARMNSAIKNILLQLQKYRTEMQTFERVKSSTGPERLESVTRNFQKTFAGIFEAIQRNYTQYLDDQRNQQRAERANALLQLNTPALRTAMNTLLEELSAIRSTLFAVHDMTTGMRAPLVQLAGRAETVIEALGRASETCTDAAGGEAAGRHAQRMLALEAAHHLRRWAAPLQPVTAG